MEKELLFRRQFIIGKNIDNKLNWNKTQLSNELVLYNHKDLNIEIEENDETKFILLGFAVDPDHISWSNSDIIKNIAKKSRNFKSMAELTINLGGRWLIIFDRDNELKILTDPASLRRLFYTKTNELLIGSSIAIINYYKEQNLSKDPKLLKFINSKFYRINEDEWYIDGTIYDNIFKVLPNTYLDVIKRKTFRFWIDIDKTGYEENIKRVADILVNEIKALYSRTDNVFLSISSGLDSRIMLGAIHKANLDIKAFVSTMNFLTEKSSDVYIPKKILSDYGEELIILNNLEELREDFLDIYERSIESARKLPKNLTIQAIYDRFDNPYIITGNVAEVIAHDFDKDDAKDGAELSKLIGIPKDIDYFNKYLDQWLDSIKPLLEEHEDIIPMKLFRWEIITGNWGTLYQAESDIANEEFPPFNNREIFLRFWQASLEKNCGKHEVYIDVLKLLDEKLLNYPINPLNRKEKITKFLKNNISHTNYMRLRNLLKS
ncbi:hypothetical protein [Anaerococcus porci]|uniref:hypothetical protein n=1 Tax=Anaerococcus porci TaxID=2652269 RepID=UPI002A758C0C|nr:hypothetical protein [Anaerococcus porci]MDY3007037.1 hypothetical protein [Anaerococcus porci]